MFDAVLVPGGGVRAGGELPLWVQRRLDRAAELDAPYIVTLSAGTPHRPPPLDDRGSPIFESHAGARYLIERGVPSERIVAETTSYDTIGNAYFARTIHSDPAGWQKLAVVTSAFHMPRTRLAFEWVFALPPLAHPYHLSFFETADEGLTPATLTARLDKERQSIEALEATVRDIRDLASLHRWLHLRHSAYAVGGQRRPLGDALRDSY